MLKNIAVQTSSLVRFLWKSLTTNQYGFTSAGIRDGRVKVGTTKSFYQSCNDLPFNVFKKCFVDRQFHLLGEGDDEYLEMLWIKHYSEFCVISKDESVQYWLDDYSNLVVQESRVLRAKSCLAVLLIGRSEAALAGLEKLGISYTFSDETYAQDLSDTYNAIVNMENNLTLLVNDLKKKQPTEPVTYEVFDRNITAMEQVFKHPINVETLTAQMYAVKLVSLLEIINKNKPDGTD